MANLIRKRNKIRKRIYVIITVIAAGILYLLIAAHSAAHPPAGDPGTIRADSTNIQPAADKKIVCLDPGHGGYDSGTTSPSGIMEKDINLKVALKLGKLLEKDFNVIYTRTTDEMKGATQREDLQIRCDFANNAGADIYVSLHCNFDKSSSKSRGNEIWCTVPGSKGEELAKSIEKQTAETGFTKDRGLRYQTDGELFVLKNTKAAAVLIEMGFLSNSEDCDFLNSEKSEDGYAQAIAQGIRDYFSAE